MPGLDVGAACELPWWQLHFISLYERLSAVAGYAGSYLKRL